MTWKAHAEDDFAYGQIAIRLADVRDDQVLVVIGAHEGAMDAEWQNDGFEVPPLIRLPIEAVEALRDALNGHLPPRDDTDLHEALAVERSRVDRILERVLRADR